MKTAESEKKTREYQKQGITKSEYEAVHVWIRKSHGKAIGCTICNTENKQRFEWALKKGFRYEKNINNYMPLCPSCHRTYDVTDEFRQACSDRLKANPPDKEGKRLPSQRGKFGGFHQTAKKIKSTDKDGVVELFDSLVDAFNKYGYKANCVSMCLIGKHKTSHGKKWEYQ